MRLTVLVDNSTLIDRYFLAEPGLSIHLEADGRSVLFDAGYSDVLVRNAPGLGIDLLDLDHIVLSHSHLDHTWGLGPLFALFTQASIEGREVKRPTLTAHPEVFASRTLDGVPQLGSMLDRGRAERFCDLRLSAEPVWLTPNLAFLGRIPLDYAFERPDPMGVILDGETERECLMEDDSALAYKADSGLVVITGCSHAGICNIVRQAQRVCNQRRVLDIVGGLHLLSPSERRMRETLDFMDMLSPDKLHPCHCTDLKSKFQLSTVADIEETGVGLVLEYEDRTESD